MRFKPSNILPRLLVVDRDDRMLVIYKWSPRLRRYRQELHFEVTVGKFGHDTPHGLYFVEGKSRTPDWRVPKDLDYDPEMWGKLYKFGEPGNPFEGGFISLHGKTSGIGIHGTSFDPQTGTAASHGCVRMKTEDLLRIYDRVSVHTPVYLH